MTSLLIRNVDEALHKRLKAGAAANRHSLEEEARDLLRLAIARRDSATRETFAEASQRLFGGAHGIDLEIPPRSSSKDRPPPDFSGPEFDHA